MEPKTCGPRLVKGVARLAHFSVCFPTVFLFALSMPVGVTLSQQTNEAENAATREHRGCDRHGDPLPNCAVERLGSWRPIQGAGPGSLSRDGTRLACDGCLWSVPDGRLLHYLDLVSDERLHPQRGVTWTRADRTAAVLAPDGNAVVLPGSSKVLVWSFMGEESVQILGEDDRYVDGCAFSPDGKLLAWGSIIPGPDGPVESMIVIYDAATGKFIRKINLPSRIAKLCGSPTDPFVLAVLEGGTAGLWDISTGARRWSVNKRDDARPILDCDKIQDVAFSPDGKRFATASDNEVAIWSVETGEKVLAISQGSCAITNLAFVPPGRLLAALKRDRLPSTLLGAANASELVTWDTTTGKRVEQRGFANWHHAFAFLPDGKLLVGPSCGGLCLRRFPEGTDPMNIRGHLSAVSHASFLSGDLLLSGANDRTTMLWDLKTAAPVWQLSDESYPKPLVRSPENLAVAPQRRLLAMEFYGSPRHVEIWDLADKKRKNTIPLTQMQFPEAMMFSPDGNSLACGDEAENLVVFDVESGNVIRRWSKKNWTPKAADLVGPSELLPWYGNRTVSMAVAGEDTGIMALSWLMNGQTIVAATPSKVVWLDAQTGKLERESSASSDVSQGAVGVQKSRIFRRYVTFSPNGKLMAEIDNTTVWMVSDADSGRVIWTSEDVENTFDGNVIAFSPDSTLIAGSAFGSVSLVEATTGKELALAATDQGRVEAVGFSLDGRFLATGGRNGTILIFDVVQMLASNSGKSGDAQVSSSHENTKTDAAE